MFSVDMSTLCVPRRRVAIRFSPPRVDRMRVVRSFSARDPKACGMFSPAHDPKAFGLFSPTCGQKARGMLCPARGPQANGMICLTRGSKACSMFTRARGLKACGMLLPGAWLEGVRMFSFARGPKVHVASCPGHVARRLWYVCSMWLVPHSSLPEGAWHVSQRVARRNVVCCPWRVTRRRAGWLPQRVAQRRAMCFRRPSGQKA